MTNGLAHKHARRIMNFRSVISSLLACALYIAPCLDAGLPKDKKPKQDPVLKGLPISDLTADEAILHALNRLAYGPRPGDIERIKRIGLSTWIDQQLNPNSIDDKAVQARLDDLPTLRLSTAKLIEDYPQAKQAAKKAAVAQKLQNPAQTRADQAAATVAQDSDVNSGSMQHSNANADMTNADTPSSMKQPSANTATPGAGQRAALSVDPNAVPRVIADDS